jgi:hypothetical protein
MAIEEYPETHQTGLITIEKRLKKGGMIGDFGIQIAADGRIWICIDGVAAIRFKPFKKQLIDQLDNA